MTDALNNACGGREQAFHVQQWEGLMGVGEVWRCTLVSYLSVQSLKALNSRNTVKELSLEDVYHNTLLCSSYVFDTDYSIICCNVKYIYLEHVHQMMTLFDVVSVKCILSTSMHACHIAGHLLWCVLVKKNVCQFI